MIEVIVKEMTLQVFKHLIHFWKIWELFVGVKTNRSTVEW